MVGMIRRTGFTLQVTVHDPAVHYLCHVYGVVFQCTACKTLKYV